MAFPHHIFVNQNRGGRLCVPSLKVRNMGRSGEGDEGLRLSDLGHSHSDRFSFNPYAYLSPPDIERLP